MITNVNGEFDEFRHQLLITMARKLAGKDGTFTISAEDIDANGQYGLNVEVDQASRSFIFKVWKKS